MSAGLDATTFTLLLVAGSACGLAVGAIGPLAGLFVPPCLFILLPAVGIDQALTPKIAVATALAVLIPVSFVRTRASSNAGPFDWELFCLLGCAAAAGAAIALLTADSLDGTTFTALSLVVTVMLIFRVLRQDGREGEPRPTSRAGVLSLSLKTMAAGTLGALTGVNAMLLRPETFESVLSPASARQMASVLAIPLAIGGTLGFGLSPAACGNACVGYIYLPAAAALGMAMALTIPIGLKIGPNLQKKPAKKVGTGIYLATVGLAIAINLPSPEAIADLPRSAAEYLLGSLCDQGPTPSQPPPPDELSGLASSIASPDYPENIPQSR